MSKPKPEVEPPLSKARVRREKNGEFAVRTIGQKYSLTQDVFHRVLVMPWWRFFLWVCVGHLTANTIFAGLYLLQPGALAGARPGSFEDAFSFSVQTLGTIGYGVISPATTYAHVLVTMETLIGMLAIAIVTGLTFAKFSRPQSRVLFADKVVIGHRDGKRCVMVRLANERHNNIVEATIRMVVLSNHKTSEGENLRIPYGLPLVRDTNPFFRFTWTAAHVIDEASPFFGDDAAKTLEGKNAVLLVTMTGLDETIAQAVHARRTYEMRELVWNARYKDVLSVDEDGTRVVDYEKFHEVVAET